MDEKTTKIYLERIKQAEDKRDSSMGELWRDCLRRYRSRVQTQREGSNIFVPHTFMQCEVIKARVEESLFSSRPYIAALPREGSDSALANKMQTLLDWQLNDRINLPRLISDCVTSSVIIYGTGVVYTGWELRTRHIKHGYWRENELGLPVQTAEERDIVVYDDPVVANIPLSDFFVDDQADSIERARFCGHREYLTRAMLEDLEFQGKYQLDWDKLKPLDDTEHTGTTDDSFAADDLKGMYLIHHYWEDERHLVFVNRCQCVCDEPNPFWHGLKPYDKCCYVSLPGEFYGMGIPELLAGLQDELNTSRNQRIDYASMTLRRMWKLRRGCGLTARDLIWRQNGVLQVENMDDVQEINIQTLPGYAFTNEAELKQDMQDVTGCHDILMGTAYVKETATTTLTRDNNASLRFKSVVRAIIQDLLVPIAKKCALLDQQFLASKRIIRLLGDNTEQMFSVDPEELNGEYDVIYCGTAIESAANKELNKQRALQAYSLALSDPAYQKDDIARLKLFSKVLTALEMKEADMLLPDTATSDEATSSFDSQVNASADDSGTDQPAVRLHHLPK